VEGYLLLIALIATVLAVYWSVRNDARIAGKPVTGLFAYTPGREPRPPARTSLVAPMPDRSPPPPNPRAAE
jgi:hypothetical protein